MSFSTNSSSSQQSEINVTPLIDILLVLLIIFMVIVPTHQHGVDSSIPQGKATTATLPPVTVQVVRHNEGLPAQYLVNQRVVPSTELQPLLQSMFAAREDHTLIVQADRDLSYQQVASVVDLGKQAGADRVSLAGLPKL